MKPKVVIIGHGYASRLSIIRSVGEMGCEVTVIVMTPRKNASKKPIDCYSKFVNHYYFCDRKQERETLIPLLLEKCIDSQQKVLLIPDGDDVVATIDNNKELLKDHFLFPHIIKEPSSMEYWMEKTHQKQLAKKIGLNVTDSIIVDIKDGHYTIPSEIQYPCFPKPLATLNGGKDGMKRCDNANELSVVFDQFITKTKDVKVLVEDFKEIDKEYALLGFSDGENVIIPGVLEFLTVSKYFKGIALQGKVMPVSGFEDLIEKFKQLVLEVGFVGVFDIDFFKSDNVLYFCELNLRYGGSGYAIKKMGVNLLAMMVKHFYGESIENMTKTITDNAVYVNDRMCMDDWIYGFISLAEYKRYIYSADIRFVPDHIDTMPEKVYNKMYRNSWIKIFVQRLIGKRHVK